MFDNYIAVDWAQSVMAIGSVTKKGKQETVVVPSDVGELRKYLKRLKGSKILVLEEGTASQYLYTELRESVDELIVCDPYRNRLLSEGPKTDKIDTEKLLKLLKADLLKPVFHSGDEFIAMRKLVSGYEDLVNLGVRLQNQLSALYRSVASKKGATKLQGNGEFVEAGIEKGLEYYSEQKTKYEEKFDELRKKHIVISRLMTIPGIGLIGAVKLLARVVDAKRFPDSGHFLSYAGLIKLEKQSGGKSYGTKATRHCRVLKAVFKTAALNALKEKNDTVFLEYYRYLVTKKHRPEHTARHAVARKIAEVSLAIMKTGKKFDEVRWQVRTQNK